jgi:hypothetical protein
MLVGGAVRVGVALVVECLPSKGEALSSNPSTRKKKKSEITRRGLGKSVF